MIRTPFGSSRFPSCHVASGRSDEALKMVSADWRNQGRDDLRIDAQASFSPFSAAIIRSAPERRNTGALDRQIKFTYGSTYRMFAQAILLRAFLGVPAGTTQGERVR